MGWWGSYIGKNASMREIRKAIEKDVGCPVVSLKFGYAICVVGKEQIDPNFLNKKEGDPWRGWNPECENMIIIALWRYSAGELMIKQVSESMGPCQYNVPLKYINAPCKIEDTYHWRDKVRQFHLNKKRQTRFVRTLKHGDPFLVYDEVFVYDAPRNASSFYAYSKNGRRFRIRFSQVSPVDQKSEKMLDTEIKVC